MITPTPKNPVPPMNSAWAKPNIASPGSPIGGYVKMLGQDDMRPSADAEDPRASIKKSIPSCMIGASQPV